MKKILLSTFALLFAFNVAIAQCPAGLEITEVLVDPVGNINFDTDGDGLFEVDDEFVKICNTGTAAFNLGGFQLSDPGLSIWFTFPSPTMVMPGACVTVVNDWDGSVPPAGVLDADRGSGVINNGGDVVSLLDPAGTVCTTFDAVAGTDGCVQSATDEEIACGNPAGYSFTTPAGGAPLSIQLIDFSVVAADKNVLLKWSTANEVDNEYFSVEHSIDGRNFNEISTIEGAGTTNEKMEYEFTHTTVANGVNYYRIKQVDFDGRFTVTDIKTIEMETTTTVAVFPTLVSQDMNIRLSENLTNDTPINIVNITGQVVLESNLNKENNQKVIDATSLASGTYFLILNVDGDIQTTKFMKL